MEGELGPAGPRWGRKQKSAPIPRDAAQSAHTQFFRFNYYQTDTATIVGDAWVITCEPEWREPDKGFRSECGDASSGSDSAGAVECDRGGRHTPSVGGSPNRAPDRHCEEMGCLACLLINAAAAVHSFTTATRTLHTTSI